MKRELIVDIAIKMHSLLKIYSRNHDHGLYIPLDIDGVEHYITHSDVPLLDSLVPSGIALISTEEYEINVYETLEEFIAFTSRLSEDELIVLQDRVTIALDIYLAYNHSQIKNTEMVLDDEGRAERVFTKRKELEKYYLENISSLPEDFLTKTSELPVEEEEEQGPTLVLVEDEE